MARAFKTSELDFIKENYHRFSAGFIAKKLDRSIGAIYTRAKMLGLTNHHKRPARRMIQWDIETLKNLRNGKEMDDE